MKEKEPGKLDRRTFVKTTGLMAGGFMLAPSILSAKAHIDGADVIRVGLVGCGGRGTGAAAQALMSGQNVKLVAMGDAFRNRVDESVTQIKKELEANEVPADRFAVTEDHKYVGFDAYKKVIEQCDVVLLCTPPGFRPEHFETAVRAGKHVFMEKPVAVDAPGIRQVLAAAEIAKQKKLNVVVGLQRHYQLKYLRWVEMLHAGVIGDITASRVYWNGEGVWVNPRQPKQTEMEYQMRNWYYFNWLCGDHICEQHIHNLDVGNWVKQALPVRAFGMGGRQVRVGKDFGEIFDHHTVEYEYADGSRMYSQCRHQKGTPNLVTEAFHGTNGSAPEPGVILTRNGYKILDHNEKKDPNPYQYEHDLLFAAIAKGEYKYADAETGANSTMTAILGRMATYSGQVIEWDAALKSNVSLMPKKLDWDAAPQVLPGKDGMYPCAIPGVTQVV